MFGLALVPIVMMVGSALDYSSASNVRSKLQAAADAAALAGDAATPWSVPTCRESAKRYFQNNVSVGLLSSVPDPTVVCTPNGTRVTVEGQVDTTLLGVMGVDSIDVAALSQTSCTLQSVASGSGTTTPMMWRQNHIPNMTRIVTLGEFNTGSVKYMMTPEGRPIVRLDNPYDGPATITIRSHPNSPVGNMSFDVPSQGQFIVIIPWIPDGQVTWFVEDGPIPRTGGSATWSNVNRLERTPDMIPGTPVHNVDQERACWISK